MTSFTRESQAFSVKASAGSTTPDVKVSTDGTFSSANKGGFAAASFSGLVSIDAGIAGHGPIAFASVVSADGGLVGHGAITFASVVSADGGITVKTTADLSGATLVKLTVVSATISIPVTTSTYFKFSDASGNTFYIPVFATTGQ